MNKKILWIVLVVVLLALLLSWNRIFSATAVVPRVTDPNMLPGIQTTLAPWKAEIANLHERLADIGLPALRSEGSALHIHQHLDIFVDGEAVSVPAGIGINQGAGFISDIHTHDSSGVLHVESPTVQDFTLGQFFDIWGVRFTDDCLGGYCATASSTLSVYVNGEKVAGNPRSLVLASHQEIVVVFGTASSTPEIPSTYTFPTGE